MASDVIGKGGGDAISREQAIAALINGCPDCKYGCDGCFGSADIIRDLPAIKPPEGEARCPLCHRGIEWSLCSHAFHMKPTALRGKR